MLRALRSVAALPAVARGGRSRGRLDTARRGHGHRDDVRRPRSRLGARRRHGPVGRVRPGEARVSVQEDPRPLLPAHEARRDAHVLGAHPARGRPRADHRRLGGPVPADGRQGRDPRAAARELRDERRARDRARPRAPVARASRPADLPARLQAARARRQAVSRQPPGPARQRPPAGGERRRRRLLHPRRRERGGARRLAARGREGPGRRRALVCAGAGGRALRDPLRRYPQPGVRRRRGRVRRRRQGRRRDEAAGLDVRRQGGDDVLLLVLGRADRRRRGRVHRRDADSVPRLRAGPGRQVLALPPLGPGRIAGDEAVEGARRARHEGRPHGSRLRQGQGDRADDELGRAAAAFEHGPARARPALDVGHDRRSLAVAPGRHGRCRECR